MVAGVARVETCGEGGQQPVREVEHLLRQMTLTEKLNQLQLLSDGQVTDPTTHEILPDVAKKGIGGVFSLTDPAKINALQHVAVDDTRLHIPILFAYDTIHGYRTIFPVPIQTITSWVS